MALELAQGRLGGDRVDQAHVGHDQAHAPALQLADEVPLEQLSVRGDLPPAGPARGSRRRAGRPPRRAAADPRCARTWSRPAPRTAARPEPPAERRASGRRQRRSPRARTRGSRGCAPGAGRRSAQPCHARLAPGALAFAPVGEEAARRRSCTPARRAPRRRRRQQPLAGDRAQVDGPALAIAAGARLGAKRRVHLGAHLVAAGPAPGPMTAVTAPSPWSSESARTPSSSTPPASPRQPACSIATAPSPASATGRQSAVSTIAPTPATSVAWPSASIATASPPRPAGRSDSLHGAPVHLAARTEPSQPELPRRDGREPCAPARGPRRAGWRGCRASGS